MRIFREPLFYILPLLAISYIVYLVTIPNGSEISDVKLKRNNITKNIQLPYSVNMNHDEVFFVSFNLSVKNNKYPKFNMVPDDCLQEVLINGKVFPLDDVIGLCNWTSGVYIDFSKYVHNGLNSFELRIKNMGGPGGFRIEYPFGGFKALFLPEYIFTMIFMLSLILILKKLKFRYIAVSIILLGVIVRLILYTYTGPGQNAHDTHGHLDYLRIISEEKRLPNSNECWQCYHPSLYYISFAAVKNIADRYSPYLTNRILQQGNLLLSIACVVLGVALILNLFGNRKEAYLAAIVSVLWPGFVLVAPRISNDILFYFGTMFCMLFAQRYWKTSKNSDMLLASIGVSVALLAKSNGFVILAAWITICIISSIRSFRIRSLKFVLISVFVILLSFAISSHRMILDVFDGKKAELVTNTGGLNSFGVENTAGNYLYFDLQDYLNEPYTDPLKDKGGRQYFWNFALKTSLFGEFRLWDSPIGHIIATILSVLALIIFMIALWGIIHSKFKDIPPMLFTVFLFAALICFRIKYPYSCSNDFRYIFPVLFPLTYFAVQGTQILKDSRLRMLSYAAMLAFAGLSIVFIVGQALV